MAQRFLSILFGQNYIFKLSKRQYYLLSTYKVPGIYQHYLVLE